MQAAGQRDHARLLAVGGQEFAALAGVDLRQPAPFLLALPLEGIEGLFHLLRGELQGRAGEHVLDGLGEGVDVEMGPVMAQAQGDLHAHGVTEFFLVGVEIGRLRRTDHQNGQQDKGRNGVFHTHCASFVTMDG